VAGDGRGDEPGGQDDGSELAHPEEELGLTPQTVTAISQIVQTELQVAQWRGPMPPPEVMQQYERVVPGSANRILAMAESSTTERTKLDNKLADGELDAAKTSQGLALFLVLIAIAAAVLFFFRGNNVAGCAFLSFPVVMMIRAVVGEINKSE
jgi:uncharacterized membrane protein